MKAIERLIDITRSLREPGGCDWDRSQDYLSMRPSLVEEAYEVIEAVNNGKMDDVREELGDLLFLVVFYSRMAEEDGHFNIQDVAAEVGEKLIRRHPHVFGEEKVQDMDDILKNWEEIKKKEKSKKNKNGPEGLLANLDASLPALIKAFKVQTKAARVGFDWKTEEGVFEKIREEIDELEKEIPSGGLQKADSGERLRIEEELGDVLFSIVNLSRKLETDPEIALNGAVDRFRRRFSTMESEAQKKSKKLDQMNEQELEGLWDLAKKREANPDR